MDEYSCWTCKCGISLNTKTNKWCVGCGFDPKLHQWCSACKRNEPTAGATACGRCRGPLGPKNVDPQKAGPAGDAAKSAPKQDDAPLSKELFLRQLAAG